MNTTRRQFGQFMAAAAMGQALMGRKALAAAVPPRFSVMLWTLEKQASFDQCMEIVAAAGYQGVELVGDFQKWSPEERQRVMKKMQSLGLVFDLLSGVKAGFADPAGQQAFLDQATVQMELANSLNSAQINLKSGNRLQGLTREAQHAASIEALKRAAELAATHHVQIVIEPIDPLENPNMFLTSVDEACEIVRAVGSPHVKVLYDFYHEQRAYGNLIEKLEKNIDLVGLVHIADVPGRHEPGTGEIDYGNIYRKLAQLNYDKYITMEFYPTKDPVATLKTARLSALTAMGFAAAGAQ